MNVISSVVDVSSDDIVNRSIWFWSDTITVDNGSDFLIVCEFVGCCLLFLSCVGGGEVDCIRTCDVVWPIH